MQKLDSSQRFTEMVRQLHDGMLMRVADNGDVSEAFAVTNRVKQGCILLPTPFSLMDAYRDVCRLPDDGGCTSVHRLLFVDDDYAPNATSEGDMQRSMDLFTAAYDNFGLIINTENMVVMHQAPPDAAYNAFDFHVTGAQLQAVHNSYLDSTLSRTTKIEEEVALRIPKGSQDFGRLQSTI
nr:unnamed protein product [Spirometra erinaceieuropaei]